MAPKQTEQEFKPIYIFVILLHQCSSFKRQCDTILYSNTDQVIVAVFKLCRL